MTFWLVVHSDSFLIVQVTKSILQSNVSCIIVAYNEEYLQTLYKSLLVLYFSITPIWNLVAWQKASLNYDISVVNVTVSTIIWEFYLWIIIKISPTINEIMYNGFYLLKNSFLSFGN